MMTYKKLDDIFENLTASQKKTALFMKTNLEQICFMTAKEIGNHSGVSEATVHRIAYRMGYKSFSDLIKDLRVNYLKSRPLSKLEEKYNTAPSSDWLKEHVAEEMDILQKTYAMNPVENFDTAADIILASGRIWVAGWRMGLAITSPLRFMLNYMLGCCQMIDPIECPEIITQFSHTDTLIVSAFQRYCRKTLQIVKAAQSKNVRVIVITDCTLSPFVKYSDVAFYAATNSLYFLDSYTASLSIVNALINRISACNCDRIKNNIERTEEMYQYFGTAID